MQRSKHQSILMQLLNVYLLFVIIVLAAGVGVNLILEQQLRNDAQASDQALAQEIALETSSQLRDAETALVSLSQLVMQASSTDEQIELLQNFQVMRTGVEHVTWLDPVGSIQASWPQKGFLFGAEFSPPDVIQKARLAQNPVFEVGIAVETTFNAGVIIAEPAREADGTLKGIVVVSLSLDELSAPISTVVQAQKDLGRRLMISVIDNRGELVATPDHQRILQTVTDELPGSEQALQNHIASQTGTSLDGQDWLYSAVPVPYCGWAVIVQRPVSEALAVVTQFHLWLLIAALFFGIGGLFFWLILLNKVIRPLHFLATQHQELPVSEHAIPLQTSIIAQRKDEVGALARSFLRLEHDGLRKLGELRTLLETSNTVVRSLDPHAVVRKIIHEAQLLVDVQAAAVLLPDEEGILRVLASEGHSEHYNHVLSLSPENVSSSAVQALRYGKAVQKLLGTEQPWPSLSYDEGFRSVLAIPIISRHVGSVVLLVHRTEAHPFKQNEIDLLLLFANYATLAWEHAILYERSDERLREIAKENEHLYQHASEEKQRLEAIMGSMSDGLVLTASDGCIAYANQSASTIVGLSRTSLERQPITVLYKALSSSAINPSAGEHSFADASLDDVLKIQQNGQQRAIHIRSFEVGNATGHVGSGLLLRDVTREHELDEFKTTLLAAVGHELRTPLAAIKGHASTLLQDDVLWSQEDQHHFLQTISNEADRLARLVSNLLDLSRQEAGLLLLNCIPVRVQELIERSIESFDARFSLHIPDDLPEVNGDRARIEVVLQNLIHNALLYGDGTVTISAEKLDECIVLSIADEGPGISPDELSHVFERFYRARDGRRRHSGGTGLGLAICKAFIEAHGMSIWVKSNLQSTTFSFSLPIVSKKITEPLEIERTETLLGEGNLQK